MGLAVRSAAVESSGTLLLCASHRADRDESPYPNWPRFFLCDAIRGTAAELPGVDRDRDLYSLDHPGRVGLLRDASGRLVIAELQPVPLADLGYHPNDALLLRHFERTAKWEMNRLHRPRRDDDFAWAYDGVVAHDGRLWWVDLSYVPFADQPDLLYTSLPFGGAPPDSTTRRAHIDLNKSSCLRASGGKLRFIMISEGEGVSSSAAIRMWTLTGSVEEGFHWQQDYRVPLSSLWARYKNLLREKFPVLAAVHPLDPRIVYIWLGERVFAFDVPAKMIVQCGQPFALPDDCDVPKGEFPSTRLLHAWVLPPSLRLKNSGMYCCYSSQIVRYVYRECSCYVVAS